MAQVEPRHDLSAAEVEGLEGRLYEFNRRALDRHDGLGLAFVARVGGGALVGAAAGYSWAGMAEIRQVWVDEAQRGNGLGRALVEAFVAEARRRGCTRVFLRTYEFQAPWLYERCGFHRVAEIADCPPGHSEFVYRRDLP